MAFDDLLGKDFLDEIKSGSDRILAIVYTAYLEDALEALLKSRLKNDKESYRELFKPTGPMGGLVNKGNLGYMLNLYSKDIRNDIKIIGKVRNKFAHRSKPVDFSDKEISDWCSDIKLLEITNSLAPNKLEIIPKKKSKEYAKTIFQCCVTGLIFQFEEMAKDPTMPGLL